MVKRTINHRDKAARCRALAKQCHRSLRNLFRTLSELHETLLARQDAARKDQAGAGRKSKPLPAVGAVGEEE